MRPLLFSLLILLFISCEKQDLCDLTQYPSAPYGNADDTLYGDTFVRYLYVCYNQSSYNKIYKVKLHEALKMKRTLCGWED